MHYSPYAFLSIHIVVHVLLYVYLGESKRIRTVPEYGHSRYLRNHGFFCFETIVFYA